MRNQNDGRTGSETTRTSVHTDWRESDQKPAACVIDAIAAVTGVPGTDQPALYESVEPDALNEILDGTPGSPHRRSGVSVSFHHYDCAVVITAGGDLSVTHQALDR